VKKFRKQKSASVKKLRKQKSASVKKQRKEKRKRKKAKVMGIIRNGFGID
jgi:hypothetical protein